MSNSTPSVNIAGVILAGGRSARMVGMGPQTNKSFCLLNQKPLIQHVIDRAQPQVDKLVISANSDTNRYQLFGLPVMGDTIPGHLGPLAGILSGMEWANSRFPASRWLASFATDSPLIPDDLVAKLLAQATAAGADIAYAASHNRSHPVIGLWATHLLDDLKRQLLEKQERKVERWIQQHTFVEVPFDAENQDPFFNINTPEDLATAEHLLTPSASPVGLNKK